MELQCLKGHSTFFLEIGSFLGSFSVKPNWTSVTRLYLVPSQWDQKLSVYWYSSKYQKIGRMDSKKVKPNCLTLGELQNKPISKEEEYPFKYTHLSMWQNTTNDKKYDRISSKTQWADLLSTAY